ncbi:MAG: TonB family protein [Sphingomonas bacterium]|nr:TonB family protein [Sphingomonas bacterium]MDB5717311.1 TonB family protein [Sphingomonas bacterium]
MVAIGFVALLHAVIGYAFVTGLAYNVVKKAVADLKTFDVEEAPPPPEEKPPPPPPEQKVEPPPMVAPPPIVQSPVSVAPPIQTVATPPPAPVITPTAPPAPPPPPAPKLASPAVERGNPGSWVTNDDYPSRALREEREGTTAVAWDITTDGRVTNCRVTSSSGSPDLDEAACANITRRARYKPAVDNAGNPIASTGSRRVRWVMPQN